MRNIVVTQFMSLDGVTEDPHKWSMSYFNDEITTFKNDELAAADAQLLGRVTWEGFAAAWPSRDGEFADRFNAMPKYVVSQTLDRADDWNNSHIIKTDVAGEVAKIKQQAGKDILVFGSMTLVDTLMEHRLVDRYNLLVYPVVLGAGRRLFAEHRRADLALIESKTFPGGVMLLTYGPAS